MHRILTIPIIVLMMSCNKQSEKDTQEFTDLPVLEGYQTPGEVFSISIRRQYPFIDDAIYSDDDINNLNIVATVDGIAHTLTPVGDGVYTDSTIVNAEGAQYTLTFNFDEKPIVATTYIPAKPINFESSETSMTIARMDSTSGPPTSMTMPDPIDLTWDNSDGSYYLVVVENIESTLDAIRDFGDDGPPGNAFRKSPTNSTGERLSPMDFQYYGTHRVILFHVLPDYASLYNDASSSSLNLTNPSTSITNGYGIFTGLNADTIMVEISE
jgi:hypothetical protein